MPSDPHFPDFYTGAPVHPSDLWFREGLIARLWEALRSHHVILTAPRRTGKTSVMDHLAAHPHGDFLPVKIFVQDIDHPAEFILTLLDAFHDRHPDVFRALFRGGAKLVSKALGKIKEIDVSGFKLALRDSDPDWRKNWKQHGDEFFHQVRLAGKPMLYIVDEFPDMVLAMQRNHPETVRPFLAWFRGHRQNPHPKADPIRWLLGGSVNLSSTLDALGCLDKINDFQEEPLPVLTPAQVTEFVRRMLGARGVQFRPTVPRKLAALLGRPVPLFLQMLTQNLARAYTQTGRTLGPADVQRAFDDLVVNSAARDKLQHYHSRIEQYYPAPKNSAAYDLLGRLSTRSEAFTRAALYQMFERLLHAQGDSRARELRRRLFNELLRDLENDFYVSEIAADRYDFASGILKAWWRKYYA